LVLIDRPDAPQSEIRIGHLAPPRSTPDFPALMMLETILGGSFTSRLVQNLRETHGYTYEISAHFALHRGPGRLEIATAVETDVTGPAISEILKELESISHGAGEAEMRKARALVDHSLVETIAEGHETALAFADLFLDALPFARFAELPHDLDRQDVPALAAAAARLFHPSEALVVVVGDRKRIEGALRELPIGKTLEVRNAAGEPAP
jgi:zinc protease